jgi:hypothetical protein
MALMATVTMMVTDFPLILLLVPGVACRTVQIGAMVCLSFTGLGTLMLRQPTIQLASANATVVTPHSKKIALCVRQEAIAPTVFKCMDFPTIHHTNPTRS